MQQSRVEHNVTVVAHECVATFEVDVLTIEVDAEACLRQKIVQKIVAESLLKLKVCATLVHLLAYHFDGNSGIEIGQHLIELLVLQQAVKHFGQLFRLKRPDSVKLMYIHM